MRLPNGLPTVTVPALHLNMVRNPSNDLVCLCVCVCDGVVV